MEKKQIRAVYNDKTIRVYQAYPEVIAKEAVSLGTFGPHFKNDPETGITMEEWKQKVQTSDIHCQWDPERDIWGNPLEYQSIQLGLREQAVESYVNDWIVSIEDITEYVTELDAMRKAGRDITERLPEERVYENI